LETFTIPADYRERLRAWATAEHTQPVDSEAGRRRLTTQLARLKDVYVLGDLSKEAYLAERERLKRELAMLEAQTHGDDGRLSRLATFLASIATAWDAATAEQRNRLVRRLFEEVVIQDKLVMKVKPRPELCGFFALDYVQRQATYRSRGREEHRVRPLLLR
jgi:hypothetical protein